MKFNLPEKFLPRLVMTLFGVIICAIAVGFFKNSLFGVDPFQCFAQGSHAGLFSRFPYGNYYIVLIKKIYIIYGQIIHIILQKKRKSYLIKKIHTGKNSFQAEIKEP